MFGVVSLTMGNSVFPVRNRLSADKERLRELLLRQPLFAARLPDFFAEALHYGFVSCEKYTSVVKESALPFASVPLSITPTLSNA